MKKSGYFMLITVAAFEIISPGVCSKSFPATAPPTSPQPSESDGMLGESHLQKFTQDESVAIHPLKIQIPSAIFNQKDQSDGRMKDEQKRNELGTISKRYTTDMLKAMSSNVMRTCDTVDVQIKLNLEEANGTGGRGKWLQLVITKLLRQLNTEVKDNCSKVYEHLTEIKSQIDEAFSKSEALLANFVETVKQPFNSATDELKNRYTSIVDKISAEYTKHFSRFEQFKRKSVSQLENIYREIMDEGEAVIADVNRLSTKHTQDLMSGHYDKEFVKKYLEQETENITVEMRETAKEIKEKMSNEIQKIMENAITRAESTSSQGKTTDENVKNLST